MSKITLFGYNGFGQLNYITGEETGDTVSKYQLMCTNCKELSFSWNSIIVIDDDGALLSGNLFNNGHNRLKLPNNSKIIKGTVNRNRCFVIDNEGHCWIYSFYNNDWISFTDLLPLENEDIGNVHKIACTDFTNLALTDNNIIYNFLELKQVISPNYNAIDVAVGFEHYLLLTNGGKVYSWGGNRGQLGHGNLEDVEFPQEIEYFSTLKIIAIAADGWHSLAITDDGDLYTWGWNRYGQLGQASENEEVGQSGYVINIPQPVVFEDPNAFVELGSCGSNHTIVKMKNNSIWGCGSNKWEQLGLKRKSNNGKHWFGSMTKLNLQDNNLKVKKIICGSWNSAILY